MSKHSSSNTSKYEAIVLAVATGVSIIEWCRQTGTSRTMVSQWQTDPQFERDVAKIRRELLQRAIGRFTAAVDKVADGMLELAEKAVSEPTKLAAQRAVLENLVQLTEVAEFKRRLEAVERRLDEGRGRPWPASPSSRRRSPPTRTAPPWTCDSEGVRCD